MAAAKMTALAVKRIYEPPTDSDGARILVDRLWPRGIAKDKAHIDLWLTDIAPSHKLRQRFHGRPAGWDAFRDAYFAELHEPAAHMAATALLDRLRQGRPVTLLYAARDETHNNAVALRLWLERHRQKRQPS